MASYQRRRGRVALVYKSKTTIDRRGNEVQVVDMENPYQVKAAFVPLRPAKAEVPGQQDIDTYQMLVDHDLPGVDSWSRVYWRGTWWDVAAPPKYHHGTRHTRHLSIDIRRRS